MELNKRFELLTYPLQEDCSNQLELIQHGWDSRIRTCIYIINSDGHYHYAISQYKNGGRYGTRTHNVLFRHYWFSRSVPRPAGHLPFMVRMSGFEPEYLSVMSRLRSPILLHSLIGIPFENWTQILGLKILCTNHYAKGTVILWCSRQDSNL